MSRLFVFVTAMVFLTSSAYAREKCDDIQNQSISGISDIVHTTLLSRPECRRLNEIWTSRDRFFTYPPRNFENRFSRAFTDCQTGLFNGCYKNLKAINESDLNSAFEEFKKDPYLRMDDPAGMCIQRAYILAEKLSNQGYKVEIAKFQSHTLVGLVRNKNNNIVGVSEYASGIEKGYHYVVSIEVRLPNGRIEKRILDPQYADRPMSLAEYSNRLTGSSCTKNPKPEGCEVEFGPPVIFNYQKHEPIRFLYGFEPMVNPCGWNMLHRVNEDIKVSIENTHMRAQMKKPKEFQLTLSDKELLRTLQVGNLREKIELIQSDIYELEDQLQNDTSLQSRRAIESSIRKYRKTIEGLQYEISIRGK